LHTPEAPLDKGPLDKKSNSGIIGKTMKVQFFKTPPDFRHWLAENHESCTLLWVGFYKKSSDNPSISYPEAVDEALCFGWIDGVRRSVSSDAYTVRFTPRKPNSRWSMVNIKRVKALSDAGRMSPAGLKAFAGAEDQPRELSYELRHQARFDQKSLKLLRANEKAWAFFQAQPPGYRQMATFWVVSAKKEETRQKRLATLICDCQAGQLIKPLRKNAKSKSS
jgi:uncharacterized protein YdeI (YjbR/CyaY-like superfamily)